MLLFFLSMEMPIIVYNYSQTVLKYCFYLYDLYLNVIDKGFSGAETRRRLLVHYLEFLPK
jgi:hypothetical protein